MAERKYLETLAFASVVSPSFWHKFTELKLDVDMLLENDRNIWGQYSNLTIQSVKTPLFEVDSPSFNKQCTIQNPYLPAYGVLINKNTIEQFKNSDKSELLATQSKIIQDWIENGEAAEKPFLLNYFFILSFSDLKKHHYYYWFCFPSLQKLEITIVHTFPIHIVFGSHLKTKLIANYNEFDTENKPFFFVKKSQNDIEVLALKFVKSLDSSTVLHEYYFAFADPSSSPEHPGWPLRNYLAFLLHTCPFLSGNTINILAFRLNRKGNTLSCDNSVIFNVVLPTVSTKEFSWTVGWEKNERGKYGPKLSNMRNSMNPLRLAEAAVDLNLKLMKWQLLPNLDLKKNKDVKCILLGAGTLGCSVARGLLAWGVKDITFVDNAYVSFSNPVRQSLFVYKDCVQNKTKVEAAAESLERIYPGANGTAHHLTVPMPGHTVGESLLSQTKENVQTLTRLIAEHDIIFLLMDSRESRWLPTLLGAYFKKIVINAALGFDTYLVMRHGYQSTYPDYVGSETGTSSADTVKIITGSRLGCYFCNDVTAPGNSLKDRTLDQQCTVTRPGVSAIAGALAVELAISLLQHPDGANASAFYKIGNPTIECSNREDSMLGIIPHSIRGFLGNFTHMLPATEKYKQCVACSDIVINEYKARGFEFLLNVFDSCKYLEQLTGLAKIQEEINDLEIWDLEDYEDDNNDDVSDDSP